MIGAAVDYRRAASLEDALAALADPEARALAGGQSLLPLMKLRVVRPGVVVDIGRLDLAGTELHEGEIRIGATTPWRILALAEGALARPALAAIPECAVGIGDLQVRNRGTIGGSIAHADPASDMPAPLLALGAAVELRSAGGTRTLPLADVFLGPFTTALAPGELIVGVTVPSPPSGSGSAYAKIEHPASGFALAGAAVLVRPDGTSRVAVTGVGARPYALPEGDLDDAIAGAEVYGDDFAPDDYRRHLVRVVASRALEQARARAQKDLQWTA